MTPAEHVTVFLLRIIAEAAFRCKPCRMRVWMDCVFEAEDIEDACSS